MEKCVDRPGSNYNRMDLFKGRNEMGLVHSTVERQKERMGRRAWEENEGDH